MNKRVLQDWPKNQCSVPRDTAHKTPHVTPRVCLESSARFVCLKTPTKHTRARDINSSTQAHTAAN